MKSRIILFVLGFLLWLALSWRVNLENFVIALAVGILVAWLTADMFPASTDIFRRPSRYLWFFYYLPLFVWECVKANIDGAFRVIHPDLPIKPGIVKIKTQLKSDIALTFLANTLTLKPGTMTVDIDKENGLLYVHWANVESQDIDKATELIAGKFERILKKVFE